MERVRRETLPIPTWVDEDFYNYRSKHPPLHGIFDAKEALKDVRRASRLERPERYQAFLKQLAAQQDALIQCRLVLEERFNHHPDTDRTEAAALLGRFADTYGFTDDYKERMSNILDSYYRTRQKVVERYRQWPSDAHGLVTSLTGMTFSPDTYLKVTLGPLSIDVTTDSTTIRKIFDESEGAATSGQVAGFASRTYDGINFSFIAFDTTYNKRVLMHEHEHQINRLLREHFETNWPDLVDGRELKKWMYAEYRSPGGPERLPELRAHFTEVLRRQRDAAYSRVKDEFLAFAKDGTPIESAEQFMRARDAGPYDYLHKLRTEFADDSLFGDIATTSLVDEYDATIHKAATAVESLEQIHPRASILALLSQPPLTEWPQIAMRALRNNTARNEVTRTHVRKLAKYKRNLSRDQSSEPQ